MVNLARQHSDLCLMFQYRATWTWGKMSSAARLSKLSESNFYFYEETITQIILLYLAERSSSKLCIRSYSRSEESKTGADWLFSFSDRQSKKHISILIQAKRLYPPKDSDSPIYGSLDIRNGQMKKLRKHAYNEKAVPLYVFFNGDFLFGRSSDFSTPLNWYSYWCKQCPNHYSCRLRESHFGCCIVPISALPPGCHNPTPGEIRFMYPWHLLFCMDEPSGGQRKALPFIVSESLKNMHKKSCYHEDEDLLDPSEWEDICKYLEPQNGLPPWVDLLRKTAEREEGKQKIDMQTQNDLEAYMEKKGIRHLVHIREAKPD